MNLFDIVILLVLLSWVGGFSFHIGGDSIHFLLLTALVMLGVRFASSRRV